MKKLFFLSAVCFGLATCVQAQTTKKELKSEIKMDKEMGKNGKPDEHKARKELRKLEGNAVSYKSTQAFEMAYPKITPVSTERLDNFDEFDFIQDGNKIAAYYDDEAKLVGTTQKKTYMDLPAKSREWIAENYKDYIPINALFLDNNEYNDTNMILYKTQFEPVDSYFVEMSNGFKVIVLQVEMDGQVNYFTRVI